MGATAILLQVAMLRQLLTIFSGNELVIGIILSVWLSVVGTGSLLVRRIRLPYAFALSFFLVAVVSHTSLISALLVRPVLQLEFGEIISISATIISVTALLLPLCLLLGAQFPLAVSYSGNNTPLVYGIEAIGSLAGGIIFTFLLSGNMDLFTLTLLISILNMLTGILLAGDRRYFILLLLPFLLYFASEKTVSHVAWKGGEQIDKTESRYGEIMTVKTGKQMNLFASGRFSFAYPDPRTEEISVHASISLHPEPRSLLLVGGSPALIREALKYDGIEKIVFVEMDPKIIEVSLSILSSQDRQKIRDRRVSMAGQDARRFIRQAAGDKYDLILLSLPEPSTAQINRFYTIEFFREAKAALNQGGMILLSLPTSSGYIGRTMQMLHGAVYSSLKQVFPYLQVSSEEYGIICGSDREIRTEPRILIDRYNQRAVRTDFFVPSLLSDIFSPVKTEMVRALLEMSREKNTDMKPAAYQYSLMLWLESQGSSLAVTLFENSSASAYVFIVLTAAGSIVLFRKRKVIALSIFVAGYAAMAFSLTLLLAYQAVFGYIYEMIGLLTAVFMAGIAAGSYVAGKTSRPLYWMRAAGIFSIALLLSAKFLFRYEAFFFMLNFLAGMAAGAEFITANRLIRNQQAQQGAGRLYAIELTGSFFGALLTTLVFVPLLGIHISLLLVALLKMAPVIMLFFYSHENT